MIKRVVLFALALLAAHAPADAWIAQKAAVTATSLPLHTSSAGAVTTDAYLPVGFSAQPSATDPQFSVFAIPGTIVEMRVVTPTAPTGAERWDITLRINGVNDGTFTCAITSASAGKCSVTGSLHVTVGQRASILADTTSGAASRVDVTFKFVPDTPGEAMVLAYGPAYSNSATQAQMPSTDNPAGSGTARRYGIVPGSGTIDHMYISSNDTGGTFTYTLKNKNSGTSVTCAIATPAITCTDTTHSASFTGSSGGSPSTTIADDLLWEATPSGSPTSNAAAAVSARYVPSACTNCFPVILSGTFNFNTTNTTFYPLTGGSTVGSTTEANNRSVGLAGAKYKSISVKVITAPGAAASGKSITVGLNKNGTSTSLFCTIFEVATGCDLTLADGAEVTVANDDMLGSYVTPSNTPTASAIAISYMGKM